MTKKVHRYDKWAEFMDALINYKYNPLCDSQCDSDGRASHTNEWAQTNPWSGAHSYEEAMGYLQKGWKDGITRLKEFQRGIPSDMFDCIMPVKEYRPEMRHQVSGGGLDVAAHLTGASPEVFINEVVPHDEGQVTKGKKLLTVYMQLFNHCGMSEEAYFYRGAYTFAMIEHMENCGYSVEVWGLCHCCSGGDSSFQQLIYVKIKEFGELFDTNKLAIALCSPFMHRRFIFAIQEGREDDEIERIVGCNYGRALNKQVYDIALPEDMDLNPLYISTTNVGTEQQARENFKQILDNHMNTNVVQE